MKRRTFIKAGSMATATMMMPGILNAAVLKDVARIGFIGVGLRGRNHLGNILERSDVVIPAICDIDQNSLNQSLMMISAKGKSKPNTYGNDEFSYLEMLEKEELDGVIISTPWLWHTRMSVAAMKSGVYAGVEVSAANTMEECWDLVNTSESTGVPTMILENVCYRRDVMAVLQMAREGLFGELIHARCGYQHDLREVKFNDGIHAHGGGLEFGDKAISEASWRTEHSLKRNADVYPTHGLGPVATMFDINRGNRFTSLVSVATKARGLHDYIVNHPAGGEDHPNAKLNWKLGDIISTTISTARGESIILTHDTNLPRPYSLGFRVQGTKGITEFDYHTQRIYLEGRSPAHEWEGMNEYLNRYDHPLWKKYGEYAEDSGHGGMDFFVDHAFVEVVKRQLPAPMDAYDAAAWSAITPLSENSIANNGEPQDIPDFTRGRWMKRKNDFALGDNY